MADFENKRSILAMNHTYGAIIEVKSSKSILIEYFIKKNMIFSHTRSFFTINNLESKDLADYPVLLIE